MISFDWTSETTSKHFTGEKGKTTWELRLDMCWLKPFFLPTHHPSWLTSLKKSSDVSISHNVKLSFFILQQCHEWCGKKVQNMCFLHSSQCSLCFLFLCFLSFFLLEHLTQNHCWSSGGAVRIPTQGLSREDKNRVHVSAKMLRMQLFSYLFLQFGMPLVKHLHSNKSIKTLMYAAKDHLQIFWK